MELNLGDKVIYNCGNDKNVIGIVDLIDEDGFYVKINKPYSFYLSLHDIEDGLIEIVSINGIPYENFK